jgi:hypothetical protein
MAEHYVIEVRILGGDRSKKPAADVIGTDYELWDDTKDALKRFEELTHLLDPERHEREPMMPAYTMIPEYIVVIETAPRSKKRSVYIAKREFGGGRNLPIYNMWAKCDYEQEAIDRMMELHRMMELIPPYTMIPEYIVVIETAPRSKKRIIYIAKREFGGGRNPPLNLPIYNMGAKFDYEREAIDRMMELNKAAEAENEELLDALCRYGVIDE